MLRRLELLFVGVLAAVGVLQTAPAAPSSKHWPPAATATALLVGVLTMAALLVGVLSSELTVVLGKWYF